MANICKYKVCGADLNEQGHFADCPDHPTNIALSKRNIEKLNGEPTNSETINNVNREMDKLPPLVTPKFVLPAAEMVLPEETIKVAMAYFMQGAMGLNVEVTGFEVGDNGGYKVKFEGKKP